MGNLFGFPVPIPARLEASLTPPACGGPNLTKQPRLGQPPESCDPPGQADPAPPRAADGSRPAREGPRRPGRGGRREAPDRQGRAGKPGPPGRWGHAGYPEKTRARGHKKSGILLPRSPQAGFGPRAREGAGPAGHARAGARCGTRRVLGKAACRNGSPRQGGRGFGRRGSFLPPAGGVERTRARPCGGLGAGRPQ